MNAIHYAWHHLNLAGIFMCLVLILFFPTVALIGWLLRRKEPRWFVPVAADFTQPVRGYGLDPAFGEISRRMIDRDPAPLIAPRVYPTERGIHLADPVAPTPVHVHILDGERSNATFTDIGGIHATCIVAGCGHAVYIAPGLVSIPAARA